MDQCAAQCGIRHPYGYGQCGAGIDSSLVARAGIGSRDVRRRPARLEFGTRRLRAQAFRVVAGHPFGVASSTSSMQPRFSAVISSVSEAALITLARHCFNAVSMRLTGEAIASSVSAWCHDLNAKKNFVDGTEQSDRGFKRPG